MDLLQFALGRGKEKKVQGRFSEEEEEEEEEVALGKLLYRSERCGVGEGERCMGAGEVVKNVEEEEDVARLMVKKARGASDAPQTPKRATEAIDKMVSDADDRRIGTISNRFPCHVDIYAKRLIGGFMQYRVDMEAPNVWSLVGCAKSLDSALGWHLMQQLRWACSLQLDCPRSTSAHPHPIMQTITNI
ncbi:unnamed protein product [Hydatigera taeniaeformis]|uniref:THUMP domain-containing protein n=1 Tax=Hydatigena taeniaeformis TaxID=6205 RepID=A0A0R3X9B5_HYDTA|nr:unnamed protein product [Hydatigera taeniaeformis]